MKTWEWIGLALVAAAALGLVLALVRIRGRRSHLKERFGPEYERAVSADGTGAGERRLQQLEREHEELELRSLSPAARSRYLDEWRQAETRFVSDPRDAARAAERLVARALQERGYPEDDGRIAALVSVDHPDVAERLRHGRSMLDAADGAASTENLRKAMLDFRAVLEDVLYDVDRAA